MRLPTLPKSLTNKLHTTGVAIDDKKDDFCYERDLISLITADEIALHVLQASNNHAGYTLRDNRMPLSKVFDKAVKSIKADLYKKAHGGDVSITPSDLKLFEVVESMYEYLEGLEGLYGPFRLVETKDGIHVQAK